MEAYQTNSGGYAGEQPESSSVYLGPAWLIACGLGAILGGFFMRGTSFSWPLMMLGVGVGLVGCTMLYRNIMRVRRRNQALAATGSGPGAAAGGMPLAAMRLPIAFAGPLEARQGGSGAAARPVPPTYLVLLDQVGCPHHHQHHQQYGGLEGGSTKAAGPAGMMSNGHGCSCNRCGTVGETGGWSAGGLPGADFLALGVPVPLPPKARGRTHGPLLGEGTAAGPQGDVESAPGRRLVSQESGAGGAGGWEGAEVDASDDAAASGSRSKSDQPGAGASATASGFALVLQPEPQLLGFTASISREEEEPSWRQQQQQQEREQQQEGSGFSFASDGRMPQQLRQIDFIRMWEQQSQAQPHDPSQLQPIQLQRMERAPGQERHLQLPPPSQLPPQLQRTHSHMAQGAGHSIRRGGESPTTPSPSGPGLRAPSRQVNPAALAVLLASAPVQSSGPRS